MKKTAETGMNRTGMAMAPRKGPEQAENSWQPAPIQPGDPLAPDRVRASYEEESDPVGTVPPPASLKGALKNVAQKGLGRNPSAFLDKLAERLAFERTGTRMYGLLLAKLEAGASPTGAASAERLREFRAQEKEHFRVLWECLETLGADPTVQTPCADLAGVKSDGLVQLLSDPRTTFAQALDAILIAELADNEGWKLLITLAEGMGQDAMATSFRRALAEEDVHLDTIRGWWTELNLQEADVKG